MFCDCILRGYPLIFQQKHAVRYRKHMVLSIIGFATSNNNNEGDEQHVTSSSISMETDIVTELMLKLEQLLCIVSTLTINNVNNE